MLIVAYSVLLIGIVILIVKVIQTERRNPVKKALRKLQAEADLERRNRRRSGTTSGNDGTWSSSNDGSWWGGDSGGSDGGSDGGGGGGGD